LDLAGLTILVVNAGSTSLKLSLVDGDVARPVDEFVPADAVAHRIVHLGDLRIDAAVVENWLLPYMQEGAEIAPLHNRPALKALEEAQRALPDVPHVVVSDSYFHHTLPDEAREYAIPRELRDGYEIVRHGFHGLSVEWAADQVRAARLVVCHLGGGCSVTAVRDGRSVDTTMGWTPLEGLPGATRSGSVDPGALLYVLRHGTAAEELDRILEHESGLRALGGLDDPLGLDVFTYRVAQAVAAMATALAGIDALVFTAGIGENSARVRREVCARLGFLGVQLDNARNESAKPDAEIAADDSAVRVAVIRAREELVAARAASALLASDDRA
jgi:acetate kinase